MADDAPYKVVVEALAAQTKAIGRLAKELKVEFAQYQNAVEKRDNARAQRIADSINQRTARLAEAADALEASVPDAEVGGGPSQPPPVPGQGLPDTGPDNELPDRERPTDPDFGVDADRPNRPDQGLPPAPGRPDTGPVRPGRPTDPDFGVDADRPPVATAPDQPPPPVVGGGPITPPNRPGQGPITPEPPTLDYVAPDNVDAGENTFFDVNGSGFYDGSTVYVDGEAVDKTTFVNSNLVRFQKTFGTAGDVEVTVDEGSNSVTITVN